jgi:hypothetical protein
MLSSRDKPFFDSQFEKCKTLYGKRSAVAHGSAAKLDTEEARGLSAEIESVSRTVLLSYLEILERLHETKKCDIEGLKAEFTALDTRFRKLEKE